MNTEDDLRDSLRIFAAAASRMESPAAAWANLRAEMPTAKRRRRVVRPRLVVAGGLALTLGGAFLAADVVSHDSSPLPGTAADASTFLADAAAQANANPDAPIPPGQFRQITIQQTYLYEFGTKKIFRATTHMQIDKWVTADPTRQYLARVQELVRVDFATPEARVAARTLAPHLFARPEPRLYRMTCKGAAIEPRTPPDVVNAPCTPGWQLPTALFLASLPRDPDALLAALRKDTPPAGRPVTPLELARAKATTPDQRALSRIGVVLNSGIAPADLRAALYQAAAKIPGIQLLDDVVALDGRHGRAIGLTYNGYRQDIIISPSNGQSIGSRLVVSKDGAALPNGESNVAGALRAGDVYNAVSFTTRLTTAAPPTK
ncbi:CU044_5270 family protein [Kribbella sp. VKM Ac-2566]|uniref:CU044_5270 family protein n=1 Tax=Kribbella sp. VKM Ac-2566 TaxID=2512218 RepID=UPI00106337E9|nr:CU044_5270 family protein [Kribbella sp. VKM Ac-2566]TDX04002.1 hypothetical protein EV647_2258 [Kribbella sp. VKM Ac-2566]